MLTSVVFRKVWRDLARNKGRSSLVVLSIAVGVMAVGMILASNRVINQQLAIALGGDRLAHGMLFLDQTVDQDTFAALERVPGVDRVDGWAEATLRWRPTPEAEWKDATLTTIADYSHQVLNVLTLRSGTWPGPDTVVAEASHVGPYQVPPIGGVLYLEVNNHPRPVRVGGTLRDPLQAPPPFSQSVSLYVSREMMQTLTGVGNFNRIRFTVKGATQADVDRVAALLQKKIEKTGVQVVEQQTYRPGEHPFQKTLDGFGLVLSVMAVASLFLSVFLVVNTINAVVAHQVPQIGMMKTVGAVSSEVASIYLSGIIIYGLLSLLLAVPLGALGGDLLSRGLLTTLNIPATPFELQLSPLLVQVAAGMLTPLLAATWPILEGTRISVREAVAAYGLGRGRYGTGWVDRALGRVRGLPSILTLSLRNTFRRMGRVALTELTLIAAGAIFMMIMAASSSFEGTLDEFWKGFGFDLLFGFAQPQLVSRIGPAIQAQPGVDRVEMWLWETGKIHKAGVDDPTQEKKLSLRAVPIDTQLYQPQIVAGRNLLSTDGHAIILDQKLAKTLDVSVGDSVVIDIIGKGKTTWSVVGLTLDVIGNNGYVHFDTLAVDLGQVGRASVVEIRTQAHSLEAQQSLEKRLRDYFKKESVGVGFTLVEKDFRQQQSAAFSVITNILQVMTVLMAVVGSLGLSGTLSINVFERRREIGVMRAVGASSLDVAVVFMTEGLLLGVASWLQALPLSYLGGQLFVDALGKVFELPLLYKYPPEAALIWLGIIVGLSILASWLPSRRATQISVQESLAYE